MKKKKFIKAYAIDEETKKEFFIIALSQWDKQFIFQIILESLEDKKKLFEPAYYENN